MEFIKKRTGGFTAIGTWEEIKLYAEIKEFLNKLRQIPLLDDKCIFNWHEEHFDEVPITAEYIGPGSGKPVTITLSVQDLTRTDLLALDLIRMYHETGNIFFHDSQVINQNTNIMIEDLKKCKSVKEYLLKQFVPQAEEVSKTIAKIKKQIKESEDKVQFFKSLDYNQGEVEMKKFNASRIKSDKKKDREKIAERDSLKKMIESIKGIKLSTWERDFNDKINNIYHALKKYHELHENINECEFRPYNDACKFLSDMIKNTEIEKFYTECTLVTEESKLATIKHNIELTKKHF